MPVATAQGKDFTFPEGTTEAQMGEAIDFFFSQQAVPAAAATQLAQTQPETVPPEEPGVLGQIGELVTGEQRTTPTTERLPELGQGGLLSGEDPAQAAKLAPVLLTTADPRELSKILTSNFPNVGVSEDPQGNLFAVNNKTGAAVVLNKPGISKLDIAQGLGFASAFTPAGAAAAIPAIAGRGALTALGRAGAVGAASAATETGLQAAQQAVGGEAISTEEIALAGLLGGAGQVLGEGVSAIARAARGRVAPEVKELVKSAEETGVSLRTANLLPPETAAGNFLQRFREQLPFLEGKPLAAQQDQRVLAVGEFLENIGAKDRGHEQVILESLRGSKKALGNKAAQQFRQADEILNAFGDVPRPATSEVIREGIEKVEELGTLADPALIQQLQAIADAPQGNFGLTRRIRSEIGSLVSDFFSGKNTQIGKSGVDKLQAIKKALDSDLEQFAIDTGSREGLNKFKQANKTWAKQAQLFRESSLKNVLDKGDLVPEVVTNLLIAKKTSQGKLLFNTLGPAGKESARAALIQQAIKKAGGIDEINPNRFLTQIKKLEDQTGAFFKPVQKRQLSGLKRVLEATTRAQDFVAAGRVPTGATAAPTQAAIGGAVAGLPALIAGLGSAATLSRTFETKAVREVLLRLANTAPGSIREDKILRELMPSVLAGLQIAKAEALGAEQ